MPIWYPVPSALDILVGFLDAGRHLALVFFFVEWYLAVDQHLGINREAAVFEHRFNGDVSFFGFETWVWSGSVLLALGLGYADMDSGLVIWDFEGPRCPFRNFDFDFGFEFSLRIWIQNFSYGFISTAALDSNFFFVSCFDSTADFICYKLGLGFSLGAANLEQLDNRLEFSFDWTILNFI
ncbi:hypothetical protein RhiirC2_856851 [Rhizophagus irregularis]|uniref:Uncharacterized protein n=1 Tax=Rhizophagus irregularis TaxID=588596 RepID=A0A2N1MFN3_9GLOM|nr:hypothetical protein RhiirC2_856851 [Rhizophagus irregularis]